MADVGAESMVGGTTFRRKMIQREISRALVLNLSGKASGAPALPRISLSLTAPSLLSMLVEAAQTAVRLDPQLRKEYLHRCHQKPKAVAKVAAARKLAVRLYWMLRTQKPYPEVVRIESSPRVGLVGEN